jgi:rubrerythrin
VTDIALKHTIASARGDTGVWQCANCGLLICTAARKKFGPCPACQHTNWNKQKIPTTGIGCFIVKEIS